jgi:hypothetical protein
MGLARIGFDTHCCPQLPGLFGGYGMRPGFAESESLGDVLGGEFGGGFDDDAEGITIYSRIFPVCVVNAPELAGVGRP